MSPLAALLALAAAAVAAAAPRHDFTGSDLPKIISGADVIAPPHGCVEAGTAYAEGSPLVSGAECERCFCLGGRRRCVRPRCLVPPAGCDAAPAQPAGACCPQRYRCHHNDTAPTSTTQSFDRPGECIVEGKRVLEGDPVAGEPCAHCYCLRGTVLCQPAACAPPLLDCQPLTRPGQCCPHRYRCPSRSLPGSPVGRNRALSMHDITTPSISTASSPTAAPDREHESPPDDAPTADGGPTEPAVDRADGTTQPDNSVRVVVNGSVDCTAEVATAAAYGRDDIITEPAFLDGDSFVVNVTSSLRTNSSRPAARPGPAAAAARPAATSTTVAHNEYDYDYNEATLPPSLPNLKIIPFLAADAVVQREERLPPPAPARPPADRRRADPPPAYPPAPASPTPAPAPVPPADRRRDEAAPARHTAAPPPTGLFSPPAHIEGGFVPKGASFESDEPAPSAAPAPPTTIFTQNPIGTGTCTTADGDTVASGATVSVMCDECRCARGRLRCVRRACVTPPACRRHEPPARALSLRDASLDTYCCGELICDHERNATTTETIVEKVTEPSSRLPQWTTRPEVETTKYVQLSTEPTNPRVSVGVVDTTATVATVDRARPESDATATSPRPTAPDRRDTTPQPAPDYTEDDDDGGFSFGNVLQLLLSDSYGTTGATTSTRATLMTTHTTPPTTRRAVATEPPTPISNRIDHLLLGESTSIRKTTPRVSTTHAPPPPPAPAPTPAPAPAPSGGLLSKLAGCNIYGRMYRVGRIIAELSSACAECRCTELGVQCRALAC